MESRYLETLGKCRSISALAERVRAFGCHIVARMGSYSTAQDALQCLADHERAAQMVERSANIRDARRILRGLGYGN
jgi:hypothetical protein